MFVIEVIIFPYINIKTQENFNLIIRERKKIFEAVFQALLKRLISVIYFENQTFQNLLLALESIP